MTKNVILFVIVVLSILCAGCEGIQDASAEQMAANVDKLSVENVTEWQKESREEGVTCEFTWISNDLSVKLAHWHVCTPDAGDEDKLAKKLHGAITECCEICVNGFIEGSTGREDCRQQCLGPLSQD